MKIIVQDQLTDWAGPEAEAIVTALTYGLDHTTNRLEQFIYWTEDEYGESRLVLNNGALVEALPQLAGDERERAEAILMLLWLADGRGFLDTLRSPELSYEGRRAVVDALCLTMEWW